MDQNSIALLPYLYQREMGDLLNYLNLQIMFFEYLQSDNMLFLHFRRHLDHAPFMFWINEFLTVQI